MKTCLLTSIALAGMASAIPALKGLPQCKDIDLTNKGAIQRMLADTSPANWLDISFRNHHLMPNGEKNWMPVLYQGNHLPENSGAPALGGCTAVGGDCSIDDDCQNYKTIKGYWAFRGLLMLHSKINMIAEKLQWDTVKKSLEIDAIVNDFKTPPPDNSWSSWVAAAFSMAGSIAGLAGEDGPEPPESKTAKFGPVGATMAGSVFTMMNLAIDKDTGGDVDKTSIEAALKSVTDTAYRRLGDILKAAAGNGDRKLLEKVYPDGSVYESPIARMLNDTDLYIDESVDQQQFFKAYEYFNMHVKNKLVDEAMKTGHYVLLGDTKKDQGKCTGKGKAWLPGYKGQPQCFYLARSGDSKNCDSADVISCDPENWHPVPEDLLGKMEKNYKMDLPSYYKTLIDCEIAGNGKMDAGALSKSGEAPRCFFSLPVKSGQWQTNTGDDQLMLHYGIISYDPKTTSITGSSDERDLK